MTTACIMTALLAAPTVLADPLGTTTLDSLPCDVDPTTAAQCLWLASLPSCDTPGFAIAVQAGLLPACDASAAAVAPASGSAHCNTRDDSYECRSCRDLTTSPIIIHASCSYVGSYATLFPDSSCSPAPTTGQHCYSFGGHYGGGALSDKGHVESTLVHDAPQCNWSGTLGLFNSCSGLDTARVHRASFGSAPRDCHYTSATNYPDILGTGQGALLIVGIYSEHRKCW
ncbi:MAG: hypothetical protein AABY18_04355 [Candidatus Thermoplasmatota archaeon]